MRGGMDGLEEHWLDEIGKLETQLRQLTSGKLASRDKNVDDTETTIARIRRDIGIYEDQLARHRVSKDRPH